jgi:sec-independent protein translocase protein TatB
MFNLGAGEIAVIMIVALLLLGPDKLPELARGIGKFVREFRRQTDDVRGMVEREFYKMDQEVFAEEQPQAKRIEPPAEPAPANAEAPAAASTEGELPPPAYPSVFPPPEGVVAAKASSAAPLGLEPPAPTPAPATASTEPAASATEPGAPVRPGGEPASHG